MCIASVAIFYCGVVQAQTKPNARKIVEAMVARYKTASSYKDSGTVSLVQADPKILNRLIQHPSFKNDTLVSFKTYFQRPRLFRFDWDSPMLDWKSRMFTRSREASIWTDGKNIYEWMPSAGAENDSFTLSTSNHLGLTIDEAQRSSAAAVFPLISIFIKDASEVTFADLLNMATELSLINEEPFDDEKCYVIKANLSGAPWTLWISKQRHLLRKTRTVYSYGSFDESVETGCVMNLSRKKLAAI